MKIHIEPPKIPKPPPYPEIQWENECGDDFTGKALDFIFSIRFEFIIFIIIIIAVLILLLK